MRIRPSHLIFVSLACASCMVVAAEPQVDFIEHLSALTSGRTGSPMILKKDEIATTKAKFKPPVEIEIVAKTDSTNIRASYAADQIIFNWESAPNEFRINGGPGDGKHKFGKGLIPKNKYVTIRWIVTSKGQSIYVDEDLRFEHSGDYSMIENPVSVFSAHGSTVTVKSIRVKQLPPGAK
jgi:hypothetical protein